MALYGILGTGVSSLLIGLPLAEIFLRDQITRWAVVGTIIEVAGQPSPEARTQHRSLRGR